MSPRVHPLAPAALAAALALSAAPAGAENSGNPLRAYRPVLRYDSSETSFAQRASATTPVRGGARIYGRLAAGGGERWLQYWIYYAYNGQDRGIFRTGRHEGDWEFVQLRLGPGRMPDRATYAQHAGAESCPYPDVETDPIDGFEVPVVYVANGSHASYPRRGTVDRPWPDPNDEAGGDGREVRPRLRLITAQRPAWVAYAGRWGNTEAGWVPGEQASPPGPMFQSDRRWFEPTGYDDAARPCAAAVPGRGWQTPALVAVPAIVLGSLLAVGLRRRRRLS